MADSPIREPSADHAGRGGDKAMSKLRSRMYRLGSRGGGAPGASGRDNWASTWARLRDRDWVLLVLLLLLNVGSAYTTIVGAKQILPEGMAEIIGGSVQLMLFLMLAGFAVNRSVVRRWTAIFLFAFASVYTSFFTYYDELASEAELRAQLDRALQAHATLVSDVYQPARSRADKLDSEAEALIDLADREASRGSTTGVSGYGPVARKYAQEGNLKKVEAQRLHADIERLQPHFEYDYEGLTAEAVYQRDLSAWQLAPKDWKEDVPAPVRGDYVDMKAEVALLTPYHRVSAGEMPALTALFLALLVDGIAIFLGTAIVDGRPLYEASEHFSGVIKQGREGMGLLQSAFTGREPERKSRVPPPVEEELTLEVDLRVEGPLSSFLSTFYHAIHPETLELDYEGLLRHEKESYHVATRMLVDHLRDPAYGWLEVDRGWWFVPKNAYPALSAWLTAQIQLAQDLEAAADEASAESQSATSSRPRIALRRGA